MIVASADLSIQIRQMVSKRLLHSRKDFSGAFLQAGVSEFTMSCLSIGMSLHGGVIPLAELSSHFQTI